MHIHAHSFNHAHTHTHIFNHTHAHTHTFNHICTHSQLSYLSYVLNPNIPRASMYNVCFLFLLLQQTDLDGEVPATAVTPVTSVAQVGTTGPKRLHVSNIPFRFREADLKGLLGVCMLAPFRSFYIFDVISCLVMHRYYLSISHVCVYMCLDTHASICISICIFI